MDFWINNAYDASTYKRVNDSLRKELTNATILLKSDSIVIYDAVEMKASKNATIEAQTALANEYKNEVNKKDKANMWWKILALSAWLYELGKDLFVTIKS